MPTLTKPLPLGFTNWGTGVQPERRTTEEINRQAQPWNYPPATAAAPVRSRGSFTKADFPTRGAPATGTAPADLAAMGTPMLAAAAAAAADVRGYAAEGAPAAPGRELALQAGQPGGQDLAMRILAQPYTAAAGGGGKDLDLTSIPPAALTALGFENMEQAYGSNRELKLLQLHGALPSMTDAPEIFANKMGYLKNLNQKQLGGTDSKTAAASARSQMTELARYGREGKFTPSVVDLGDGVQAMMTSPRSAVPLKKAGAGDKPASAAGGPVMSKDGQFFQDGPGMPWKPAPKGPAGVKLDPLVVGTITEQVAALEAERNEHQQAMAKGEGRFGFMNAKSRPDRLQEIENRLAGLKASLGTGSSKAPPAAAAAKPATAPAKPGAAVDPFANLKW